MSGIISLYEKYLLGQIARTSAKVPGHVSLVLSETDLLHPGGFGKFRDYITCEDIFHWVHAPHIRQF